MNENDLATKWNGPGLLHTLLSDLSQASNLSFHNKLSGWIGLNDVVLEKSDTRSTEVKTRIRCGGSRSVCTRGKLQDTSKYVKIRNDTFSRREQEDERFLPVFLSF